MAKTAKKTAKTSASSKRRAPKAKRAAPIPLEAKIFVPRGAENPFTPGTAVYKRVDAVLKAKNKTVQYAVEHGARRGTVRYLRDHHIVKVQQTA